MYTDTLCLRFGAVAHCSVEVSGVECDVPAARIAAVGGSVAVSAAAVGLQCLPSAQQRDTLLDSGSKRRAGAVPFRFLCDLFHSCMTERSMRLNIKAY